MAIFKKRAKQIIIIGDSHTHALKKALKNSGNEDYLNAFEIYTYAKIKNDKKVGDLSLDEAKHLVSKLSKSDVVVSLTGGNQHNSVSLIQHPQKFSIVDELQSPTENIETIPTNVMRSVFDKGLRGNDFKRIAELKSSTKASYYHVGATPPKSDAKHILKKHETDFAKGGITSHGVTNEFLRLKIWKLQLEITQNLCNEIDVNYFPFPQEAQDEFGFLAKDYYAEDATHANEKFGLLMLQKLYTKFFQGE